MCELLAMMTRRAAHLTVSLDALASHSGTRDGWGAAFYQGNDVALFREPIAANDSSLVRWLVGRIEPPGLFRLSQSGSTVEQRPHCLGAPAAPGGQAVTLIVSVPLGSGAWQPLAEGEVLTVSAGVASARAMQPMPGTSLDDKPRVPDAPAE